MCKDGHNHSSFFEYYEARMKSVSRKKLHLEHRELLEILDIVASVKTMRKWQRRKSHQETILEKARPISASGGVLIRTSRMNCVKPTRS